MKRQIAGRIVKRSETFLLLTKSSPATELFGDQSRKCGFELRLASLKEAEGWKSIPAPEWGAIWLSPEVILTNADISQAWLQEEGRKNFERAAALED